MNYKEIVRKFKEEYVNPIELADMRRWLAGDYALFASRMDEVQRQRASRWITIRKGLKSATEANHEWEATEMGQEEISLKWRLKSLEKLMSAAKTRIEIAESELRSMV